MCKQQTQKTIKIRSKNNKHCSINSAVIIYNRNVCIKQSVRLFRMTNLEAAMVSKMDFTDSIETRDIQMCELKEKLKSLAGRINVTEETDVLLRGWWTKSGTHHLPSSVQTLCASSELSLTTFLLCNHAYLIWK